MKGHTMKIRVMFALVLALLLATAAGAGWVHTGGRAPHVAFDAANGNWVATWYQSFGYPDFRILAKNLNEPDQFLYPGGVEVFADGEVNFYPRVASGPNRSLVAWPRTQYSIGTVYGRMLENGVPVGDAFQVTTIVLAPDLPIDVAWGGESFLVVFGHWGTDNTSIWGRIIGEDGNPIGSTIEIASVPGTGQGVVYHPAVASNGSNWLVAYNGNNNAPDGYCIERSVVSFDGSVSSDGSCISVDYTMEPSVAAVGDNYLVVYNQDDWDDELGWRPIYKSQLLDGDGDNAGPANVLIVGGFDWQTNERPNVSCGTASCIFVVMHNSNSPNNILGLFTNTAGVPVGSSFEIDSPHPYSWPNSAYDPTTDHVLVAWEAQSSNSFGAVYASPGTEIVPKFLISADCDGCFVDGECYDVAAACDDGLYCTTDTTCSGDGVCGGGSYACPGGWFCSEEADQCFEDEQTPIELISFTAEALDEAVLLSWETATEKDNAGFNLYRSLAATGDYVKVTSDLIPAEGDAFTGASYEFVDADVTAGNTYYYKLEDISIYGVSTFHGPIDITIETEEPQFGCGMF